MKIYNLENCTNIAVADVVQCFYDFDLFKKIINIISGNYNLPEIGVFQCSGVSEFWDWVDKSNNQKTKIEHDTEQLQVCILNGKGYGIYIQKKRESKNMRQFIDWILKVETIYKRHLIDKGDTYGVLSVIEIKKKYLESPQFDNDKQYWIRELGQLNEGTYISDKIENDYYANIFEVAFTLEEIDLFQKYDTDFLTLYVQALGIYLHKTSQSHIVCFGIGDTSENMLSCKIPLVLTIDKDQSVRNNLNDIEETLNQSRIHKEYWLFEDESIILSDLDLNEGLYDLTIKKEDKQFLRIENTSDGYIQAESLLILISDDFKIKYSYRKTKLTKREIEYMHMHIFNIIKSGLSNKEQKIAEINPIGKHEIQLIVHDFNNTNRVYGNETVVELFEAQAVKNPNKVAAIFMEQTLTFSELNKKANQLANSLRNLGIVSDDFVVLMSERSFEMLIGIMGILKSGAAYVPVDPNYPESRIEYILADCDAKALVYSENNRREKRDIPTIPIFQLRSGNEENLSHRNKPEDLAYLIYTSGSTGKPKGVMIEHRNLVNLVYAYTDLYSMTEEDVVLQFASISFDQSVLEIFNTLLIGASLCLVPVNIIGNIRMLEEYLIEKGVTWLGLTPAFLKELDEKKLPDIRLIESGGAEADIDILEKWRKRAQVFNTYGPTEATVNATSFQYENYVKDRMRMPIGKPMANAQVYILNELELCGIGIPGELCIAGKGVARGYFNRPELSKEKFIPNPFGEGKLYRSGDLAKWLTDGNIEYLGRMDEQVKIRGFRIELGEIESILRKQKGIKNGAVIIRKDTLEEPFICAYYVAEEKTDVDLLKASMGKELPGYMIPAYFLQLEEIPLTTNGKINKSKLLKYEVQSEREYVEPRNANEEMLAEIFQEVLGHNKIGIFDDFFELGGHSLRATRIINLIEMKTNIRIMIKTIFSNPTIAQLGEVIGSYVEIDLKTIPKTDKKKQYVMSPVQKGLYFINKLDTLGTTYNITEIIELNGYVDIERMKAAFRELPKYHDILRTSFHESDEEPVQEVSDVVSFELEYRDITEDQIDELYTQFISPFDLKQAPLIRGIIAKIREDKYLLVLDMHHIILDGLSVEIFIKDFASLYNGETLEYADIQYKDYCEWIHTRDISLQKKYWVDLYQEDLPILDMPLDSIRPQMQSFRGTTLQKVVQKNLKIKIENFIKKVGHTEYMFFLSSLMILLSKYSRQDDIIVGSPVSGRTHRETEFMMGMFVNTLVIRGKPEKAKKYSDFSKEIKMSCLKAYENQEYPFEDLVATVVKKRDFSRNPIFDIMFAMQNFDSTPTIFEDMGVNRIFEKSGSISQFDLSVTVTSVEEEYLIDFEYCTDLFTEENIKIMMKHYMELIVQILQNPEKLIEELSVVSDLERKSLLYKFNDTVQQYFLEKTIPELFEEQVAKTPDNIAVVYKDRHVTYRELNKKVNHLASRLRELGVESNDRVVIMSERSVEMIVGIMGILKSGAAYVPVDPNYPESRIEYILTDCDAKALVYSKNIKVEKRNIAAISILQPGSGNEENPSHKNKPEDLAYLIYTSGSTGKPKGVMIEHRNLVNLVYAYTDLYSMTEKDVVLQFASISFDQSVLEIFNTLLIGAALCLVPMNVIGNIRMLEEYLIEKGVTWLGLTPAFLKELDEKKLPDIRLIESGGAAADIDILEKWRKRAQVFNTYGPTETTVNATSFQYENNVKDRMRMPIGKPMPNTQVYILNELELCGIGIPGELCIAGKGVARGYFNRPKLSKEKFIPNPFGEGRLYRSGDLAKWLSDGNIEYLGRIDEQVKIRGFRIELGEIENILKKQPQMMDAVAVIRKDQDEEDFICAFIVAEEQLDVGLVRERMKQEVPDYMIPSYVMQIEAIPVTKNGKCDKRALPQIEIQSKRGYVAPGTIIESKIVTIFEEILGLEKIGIYDDFFELGGHSLRATKVVNSMESNFGIKMSIRQIFTNPTPKELGKIVDSEIRETYQPITEVKREGFYLMSSAQKRIYMIQEMDDTGIAYNMPENVEVQGQFNLETLQKAFEKLIGRHEALRTSFHLKKDMPVQSIADEVEARISYVKANREEMVMMYQNFIQPFDLKLAPLMRIMVVEESEHKHILFMDMHHIISDGISVTILYEELVKLYNGETLKPLKLQYKDYSEWMRGRDISLQKEYWISQYRGDIPSLDMPLDFPRPRTQSYRGKAVSLLPDLKLKDRLESFAGKTKTTEYMVLLSALMIMLGKYSRQEDIIVGSPVSGRTHKDTESMVGMFVNTLAMRGKVEKEKKYLDFLSEVRENCLAAYENQEYPFEELIEAVQVGRDMSRNPLFDVMFVLQNDLTQELTFNHTKIGDGIEEFFDVVKFDLAVNVVLTETGYEFLFEYCSDLYKKESVQQMADHYLNLLEEIIENPEKKIGKIEGIDEKEKQKLLQKFNDTDMEYPKKKTIVELFEEQVKKQGNKIAVVCEDEEISYIQLNEKSNRLAQRLRDEGVGPDRYVAMMVERSVGMIVGILGILKAGGAYVPIDPGYPSERIRFMLEDCKPNIAITGNVHADICLDMLELGIYEESSYRGKGNNLELVNKSNDLAYLIYTSGTTGKPKGVMVEHYGVANLREYFKNVQKVTESDRVLQFANVVFDATISELTMSLLLGGCMYIVTEEVQKDLHKFEKYVKDHNITIGILPPQYMAQTNLNGVRALITAGSESSYELVQQNKEKMSYSNDYGPTEATVCATHWSPEEGKEIPNKIPIGKPIGNKKVYILSEDTLCGIGIPGELCIAGDGLARGYLNQEELTMEKFVKNPYGEGSMYRSGDLARWLPEGNLEFLGRIDEQVKIRGYRIELSEVESVLRKQGGIQDAAVVVKVDPSGEKGIYAYYTSENKLEIDIIRSGMQREIPDYMIPAYFMQMAEIPMNQSGKVDKKALPEIATSMQKKYTAPRNQTEEKLTEIFSTVLGFECIGIEDDFFDLGGDSIKAIRIISKCREEGLHLTVKDIMSGKTIMRTSAYVAVERLETYSQEEYQGVVEMLPIQNEFIYDWNFKRPGYFNQSMMIQSDQFNYGAIHEVLKVIVCHHDILRAVYREGCLWVKGLSEGTLYGYEEIKASHLSGEEQRTYIQDRCNILQSSMDLKNGPLVKAARIQTGEEEHLLLCAHHLIVDGVSWRILLDDFMEGYKQYLKDGKIVLPKKTASFHEWACAIKDYGKHGVSEEECSYWKSIDESVKTANLACNRSSTEAVAVDVSIVLSHEESHRLIYKTSKAYQTEITELLLAALGIAINKITKKCRIAVQLEEHGREHIGKNILTDRTVGWFTITYPVILETDQNIEDSIISVKNMIRKVPNKGVGYSALTDNHRLKPSEKIELAFNYLGDLENFIEKVDTITASQLPVGNEIAEENLLPNGMAVNCGMVNGQLEIICTYNSGKFSKDIAETLLVHYKTALIEVIECCERQEDSYRTMSDFENAELHGTDIAAINDLIDLL